MWGFLVRKVYISFVTFLFLLLSNCLKCLKNYCLYEDIWFILWSWCISPVQWIMGRAASEFVHDAAMSHIGVFFVTWAPSRSGIIINETCVTLTETKKGQTMSNTDTISDKLRPKIWAVTVHLENIAMDVWIDTFNFHVIFAFIAKLIALAEAYCQYHIFIV